MRREECSKVFSVQNCSGALESPEGLCGALRALLGLGFLLPVIILFLTMLSHFLQHVLQKTPRVHHEVHGGKQKTICSTQDNKNYIKLLRIYKT